MESDRSSLLPGMKDKGGASSASAPNVTIPNVKTIVSISVVLFALIAQALEAVGVITLSTTQQVTIWLVAGGLVVLLTIADMACSAYVTAKTPPGPPRVILADGPVTPTPVPLRDGNAGHDSSARQNGPRLPVKMADVFPGGCYLVPVSIDETYDYDEKTKTRRPAVDKITGQRVFQCRVVDMDPERKGRSRETAVKIVADQMPVPPTGAQYESVEFEGLTAIPYETDRGRVAYTSLRATGIKQAFTRPHAA